MPDYPGAPGRAGYAVGLDVAASVVALLADLAAAGYSVRDAPRSSRELFAGIAEGSAAARLTLPEYARLLAGLPADLAAKIHDAWGDPAGDPDVRDGGFVFRAQKFGNAIVALPPDRGRAAERRADYHDPVLPPRHALVAFMLWLRHVAESGRAGPYGGARHARMVAREGGRALRFLLPGSAARAGAGVLPVHRQQSRRGRAGEAPDRRGHDRAPAAAACCGGSHRRSARPRAPGGGVCPGGRARPPPPRASGAAHCGNRPALRPGARGRHCGRCRSRHGAAPHRCLALRSQGPRHQGRPARVRPRRLMRPSPRGKRGEGAGGAHLPLQGGSSSATAPLGRGAGAKQTRGASAKKARRRSGTRFWRRSTAGGSRLARPAHRGAAAATCCRPAATSTPPIRACCRRRPPWTSDGLPPTR